MNNTWYPEKDRLMQKQLMERRIRHPFRPSLAFLPDSFQCYRNNRRTSFNKNDLKPYATTGGGNVKNFPIPRQKGYC